MKRKIEGTNKFIVYLYNGKFVRGKSKINPKHWIYRQWGRISTVDENGKVIGKSKPFTDFGEMVSYMNKIMKKATNKNFK